MSVGALLMLSALLGAAWGLFRSLASPADRPQNAQERPRLHSRQRRAG